MSEQIEHIHQWFSAGGFKPGQIRCITCGMWGEEVDAQKARITELEARLETIRNEALEEAAKVCDTASIESKETEVMTANNIVEKAICRGAVEQAKKLAITIRAMKRT